MPAPTVITEETTSAPRSTARGYADATDGALGQAAAFVGATLADADASDRETLATFGEHTATVRRIGQVLRAESELPSIGLPDPEPELLRGHADRRSSSAVHALDDLSASIDTDTVRQLVPDPP